MSYRSEALAAFDQMTDREWGWFKPSGRSIQRHVFRGFIAEGRVNSELVLRNVETAKNIAEAWEVMDAVIAANRFVTMPVRRKGTGWVRELRVVS